MPVAGAPPGTLGLAVDVGLEVGEEVGDWANASPTIIAKAIIIVPRPTKLFATIKLSPPCFKIDVLILLL